MNRDSIYLALVLLLLLSTPVTALAGLVAATCPATVAAGRQVAACPDDLQVAPGTLCRLEVAKVRPTQYAVGSLAVDCNTLDFLDKVKDGEKWDQELRGHVVPAVIGPRVEDGNKPAAYITDRHHFSTGLFRATHSQDWPKKGDQQLYLCIMGRYDGHDMEGFIQALRHNQQPKLLWDRDQYGIPFKDDADLKKNFFARIKNVGELKNDPYRTLSRWVRNSHGYLKCATNTVTPAIVGDYCQKNPDNPEYFMEFVWADTWRPPLAERHDDKLYAASNKKEIKGLKKLLDGAITAAMDPSQSHQVGYNSLSPDHQPPRMLTVGFGQKKQKGCDSNPYKKYR